MKEEPYLLNVPPSSIVGHRKMEQKIKDVLSSSHCPLTAPEIAKVIGCAKKEINQVIYYINGVEKVPDTQPPKWTLKEDSSGATKRDDTSVEQDSTVSSTVTQTSASPSVKKVGATSMSPGISKFDPLTNNSKQCNDDELRSLILDVLKKQSTPLTAPEISRQLSGKISCITADCKRVLHGLQKDGRVENKSPAGTKPLWILKGSSSGATALSDSDLATYNGKPLFTFEETESEHRYKKVTKSEISRASSEQKIITDQIDTNSDQVQSNIDQIDTSSDHIQSNTDTSNDISSDQVGSSIDDTEHDNTLSKESRDEVVTMISQSSETVTQSNITIPMTGNMDPSVDLSQNSPQTSDRKPHSKPCKRKPQLAAKFTFSSTNENSSLRERILELFRNNKEQEFTAKLVSRALGLDTRDGVLYELETLVETDIIVKLNNQTYKYEE